MTWAADRRLDYIAWRLLTRGAIRREDLMRTFGVSLTQASFDLRDFQTAHPEALVYDRSAKCYVPTDGFSGCRGMDNPNVRRAISLLAGAGHPMGWRD